MIVMVASLFIIIHNIVHIMNISFDHLHVSIGVERIVNLASSTRVNILFIFLLIRR